MDKSFAHIAKLAQNQWAAPTHQQRVTRLYRNSLKLLMSWAIDRDVFREEGLKLRARFEANRGLSLGEGEGALKLGEAELREYFHPDMYVLPYMPGGSKFMRNPPPPLEIVYPDGDVPEEAFTGTNTPVWPDMVPVSFRPEMTSCIVDFGTKTMK
mmetsp:Transcript_8883/g.14433  ORF Transcript_8883/g.14433 Transcript_8883/m.14433 type:complete len:155 (-) Transcript_8883:1315-1779(-)